MWRDKTRRTRRRKPSPGLTCGRCGKRYANPLTHVCAQRSDFRKRQRAAAAAKRKAARKRRAARHDYHRCRDLDCQRVACEAYREGVLACPRSHVGD